MFLLVDCNNFYASCERVFNPSLRGKPVVVLSNNDGCAIARSQEAKDLGVGMGQPIFKRMDLVRRHDIKVYSSNFVLYGDMSRRVMRVLAQACSRMEVYSIDEAFLFMEGLPGKDTRDFGMMIHNRVKRETGLPVSVGIAQTKTLAKIANHIAKRHPRYGNVCFFPDDRSADAWLKRLPVQKVWGIGPRRAVRLERHGIKTAFQLKLCPDRWVKKNLMVTGLRTVKELRGIPCIPLEENSAPKKSVATTRSFGYEVTRFAEIKEAISAYTARTAEKARAQGSLAGYVQVFIESNPFKPGHYYENSAGAAVNPPTSYTPSLIAAAQRLLKLIYRPEYAYKRAGVILTDLAPQEKEQYDLFEEAYTDSRKQKLMLAVDAVNARTDSGKLVFAGEGLGRPWYMRQARRSKRFTTRWDELLTITI